MSKKIKKLPEPKRTCTEIIDGKQVEKQLYSDGSYGIHEDRLYNNLYEQITRYFTNGKKSTYLKYEEDYILYSEKWPDGTFRSWYPDGQLEEEKSSGNTRYLFDLDGFMVLKELPDATTIIPHREGGYSILLPNNKKVLNIDIDKYGKITSEEKITPQQQHNIQNMVKNLDDRSQNNNGLLQKLHRAGKLHR